MGRNRPFRERVAHRIAGLREAAGLTQDDLAGMTGVKGQTVSRWERAERFPSYENLVALARAFRISEEELICGQPPPDPRRHSR